MASPNRSTVLGLFSYPIPGYRPSAIYDQAWNELTVPESVPLVLPGRELFAGPLPWARFSSPNISVVEVDNVVTWTNNAVWSADDGSVINVDPPTWATREREFKQIASQLTVDRVSAVESTNYDVFDASLRATAEMMYVAVLKRLLSTNTIPNSPETFYQAAVAATTLVDADSQPLSVKALMCLTQKLNKNEGRPEQYTIALSKSAYSQFIESMTSAGSVALRHDPVTNRRQWFFDDLRVIQSAYIEDGNGLFYKADMSALPEDMQATLPPSVGRGVMIGTAHPGVVISNRRDEESEDQSLANAQFTAGLVYTTGSIAWIENLST